MTSIIVNVKLFGTLRNRVADGYDHNKGIDVSLPQGATVQDLLRNIGFSEGEAGFLVVNGVPNKLGNGLAEGDEVCLFLPLAGG